MADLLASVADLDASNSVTYSLDLPFPFSLFATSSNFWEGLVGFGLEEGFAGIEKESFMVEDGIIESPPIGSVAECFSVEIRGIAYLIR